MLKIGPYQLKNEVVLAPMSGITDRPFRMICQQLGAGMVVSEMSASVKGARMTQKSHYREVHVSEPEPRVVQIVGYDAQMMAEAAQYYVDHGASVIDINMGCPAKKVNKRSAGSALLADPDRVKRILDAVIDAVPVPVTLKIRTGIAPENRNAIAIANIAEQCGVSALTIHGRTRACMFKGQAEYDTIRKVKQAVDLPVIANGDIVDIYTARRVLQYTGADGVMVGRGAQGRPWLLNQIAAYLHSGETIAPPSLHQQRDIVLQHLEAIYQHYGDYLGVRIARKHIKWYLEDMSAGREFLVAVNKVDLPSVQLREVKRFYDQQLLLDEEVLVD